MATDVSSMPVNGNYAMHQGYGSLDQQNAYAYANGPSAQPTAAQASPAPSQPAAATHNQQAGISKDEVGWYFVETYYTTLSRSPEKLYLFYNKRSQFVSGQETDKVGVCVGQRAINDRIKELDYHDCKVRVTNVDSQASDNNIVIQVIGEISNRSQPHKKFTQTFVLATQTNGYFVLNDIFRYLIDEEDEPEPEPEAAPLEHNQQVPDAEIAAPEPAAAAVKEAEPKTLTSSMDPVAVEHDAQKVDKEIEEKVLHEPAAATEQMDPEPVNGVPAQKMAEETTADAAEPAHEAQPEPASTIEASAPADKEDDVTPEKPKDPEPTPAASPPKQAPPQPAAAPKPAVPKPNMPKTWSMIAGSANSRPAASSTPSATTTAPAPAPVPAAKPQPAARAPSSTPATPAANAPTAPAAQRAEASAGGEQDEWTSVGGSHNRQQSRQVNGQQQEAPQHRAFIRGVTDGVDGRELKSELEKYGDVVYFDISRQKNQAFIEFRTAEGYNAAVNANPHVVNGERLIVEERRYKGPPFNNRGQYGGRGRAGMNQGAPRGNYQGRGNYQTRGGRGSGTATPRGAARGGPQAA